MNSTQQRALATAATTSQRSHAIRMNLFVLVRILFQYLERVDRSILDLAREVLKDCERKHNSHDSKYETLADAVSERVRDAVGEGHWTKAREIQKQLAINQQKRKLNSMRVARGQWKRHARQHLRVNVSKPREKLPYKAARVTLSMSRKASPSAVARSREMGMDNGGNDNSRVDSQAASRTIVNSEQASSSSHDEIEGATGTLSSSGKLPLQKQVMFTTSASPISAAASAAKTSTAMAQASSF
eukprot:CAMPEP_0181094276 /NCGR_PEP_ID=MMETSP1071-20121207/9906_1 /TAXON_ID=35127 /ORGANISM="Thalassiosira sp., Strain NH16" /LENGTH=242 /DNA_ID=CAMNT_0023176593 /DNA_START=193 /DNA_END=921 /DNA_ORIENTATION=-